MKTQQQYIHSYQFEISAIKAAEKQRKIIRTKCHMFHHNFKNIPCHVTSEASLKRFYIVLFDGGLTLKTLKLANTEFCIQTLHLILLTLK